MGDRLSFLVVSLGLLSVFPTVPYIRKLAKVPIEICHHFFEEDDGFCSLDVVFAGDDLFLDDLYDVVAGLCQIQRYFCAVPFEGLQDWIDWFGLVFHGLNDFEFSSPGGDYAFIS